MASSLPRMCSTPELPRLLSSLYERRHVPKSTPLFMGSVLLPFMSTSFHFTHYESVSCQHLQNLTPTADRHLTLDASQDSLYRSLSISLLTRKHHLLPPCRIYLAQAEDGDRTRYAASLLLKAEDGDRTRYPQLGRLMLYQMSYFRIARLFAAS